ncbi:MAG: hypothetical protein ISP10_02905 [Aeromicrobium sp.]|nr:hypothetical protein [Aeromicrobium sp.]
MREHCEACEPFGLTDDISTEHAHLMLDFYCRTLKELSYDPVPFDDLDTKVGENRFSTPKYDALTHAHWMVHQTRAFLQQGRMAKAYRWIGMIQGILFMNGIFSLAELKRHNRFDLPTVRPRGR